MYKETPAYILGLHGNIGIPIEAPLPFAGGIFGQPDIPVNRAGIFRVKYSLPRSSWLDDPSRFPYGAVLPSSGPVAGLCGVDELTNGAVEPVTENKGLRTALILAAVAAGGYWLLKGK